MKFFNTSIVVAFAFIALGASVPLNAGDVAKRDDSDVCIVAGALCSSDSKCCGNLCVNGVCATSCVAVGAVCSSQSDCCGSYSCLSNVCQKSNPPCDDEGGFCWTDSDCCGSNTCVSNVCRGPQPPLPPVHIHPPNPQ